MPATCVPQNMPRANTGLSKHGDPVFAHFWSWNQNLARVCARGGGVPPQPQKHVRNGSGAFDVEAGGLVRSPHLRGPRVILGTKQCLLSPLFWLPLQTNRGLPALLRPRVARSSPRQHVFAQGGGGGTSSTASSCLQNQFGG